MIRERLRWSIALGGYVGFRFVRNATGFMDNPSTGEYGDMSRGDLLWFQPIALTDEDSLFQGGATLEGAVDMLQPNGDAIRYSLRYDISLTSLYRMDYEDTMEHHYTDAITFGIAYIWGLGGEK